MKQFLFQSPSLPISKLRIRESPGPAVRPRREIRNSPERRGRTGVPSALMKAACARVNNPGAFIGRRGCIKPQEIIEKRPMDFRPGRERRPRSRLIYRGSRARGNKCPPRHRPRGVLIITFWKRALPRERGHVRSRFQGRRGPSSLLRRVTYFQKIGSTFRENEYFCWILAKRAARIINTSIARAAQIFRCAARRN